MEIISPPESREQYAGFWLRFAAYIIDALLLSAVEFFIFLFLAGILGLTAFSSLQSLDMESLSEPEMAALIAGMIGSVLTLSLMATLVTWLYYAVMESSSRQATLGKMAVGIVVTDVQGNRISFLRATGRYFGKIVSGLILCFGYIMAGFTRRKQALHDLMAETLVVRK
jgi:uncharacterized RDD family membrane protein YckC